MESASIVEGVGVDVNAFGCRDGEARPAAVVDREDAGFGGEGLLSSLASFLEELEKDRRHLIGSLWKDVEP